MQAGDLRARVMFMVRAVISDSGDGNTQGDWQEQFTVAANIKPRLGGETVLAGRLSGTNLVNVTVRQSNSTRAITSDWMARDVRTGVGYEILSVIDPNEHAADRGKWIEILCEKGVAVAPSLSDDDYAAWMAAA